MRWILLFVLLFPIGCTAKKVPDITIISEDSDTEKKELEDAVKRHYLYPDSFDLSGATH